VQQITLLTSLDLNLPFHAVAFALYYDSVRMM
jgi:hypothetical protein